MKLCAACLEKKGVVASVGGPTCGHGEVKGVKWWPEWWSEAGMEGRRVAWLVEREKKAAGSALL